MKNYKFNWPFLSMILACLAFWGLVGFCTVRFFKGSGKEKPKVVEANNIVVFDKSCISSYLWLIDEGDTIGNLELPGDEVYLEDYDTIIVKDNNYYLDITGKILKSRWLRKKDGTMLLYIYTYDYRRE